MLEPAGITAPPVSWTRLGAASYQIDVSASSSPFVVSLAESFAPGWRLMGVPQGRSAQHVVANGYGNGWLIGPGEAFTARLVYAPDRGMHAAGMVSLFGFLAVPPSLLHRRRRRSRLLRHHDDDAAEPGSSPAQDSAAARAGLMASWSPTWW
jgi:hypothetical protein